MVEDSKKNKRKRGADLGVEDYEDFAPETGPPAPGPKRGGGGVKKTGVLTVVFQASKTPFSSTPPFEPFGRRSDFRRESSVFLHPQIEHLFSLVFLRLLHHTDLDPFLFRREIAKKGVRFGGGRKRSFHA